MPHKTIDPSRPTPGTPHRNGKGDSPRNLGPSFRTNYDRICWRGKKAAASASAREVEADANDKGPIDADDYRFAHARQPSAAKRDHDLAERESDAAQVMDIPMSQLWRPPHGTP